MSAESKIILVFGPTASGKSKFAIKLAKKLNGEIVNADSMQIYKEFSHLTARPTKKDLKKIKHHLYGFVNVKKNFSTGKWLKLATKIIKEIRKRKKIPVLVGGTGLYFKALTHGLVKIPKIPNSFRKKIRSLHLQIGQDKFYKNLKKIDPNIMKKINSNDIQRSIRAYEVIKFTKISLYDWFKKTKPTFSQNDLIKIYIDFPRDELMRRIEKRAHSMLRKGAVSEVKKFIRLRVNKDNSCHKVIGVTQIGQYLSKKYDLNFAKEQIVIKTRQYAKRQTTWARGQMRDWKKINSQTLNSYIKKL